MSHEIEVKGRFWVDKDGDVWGSRTATPELASPIHPWRQYLGYQASYNPETPWIPTEKLRKSINTSPVREISYQECVNRVLLAHVHKVEEFLDRPWQ